MSVELEAVVDNFKTVLAAARGRFGRDYIRGLPQGKLLDALDAGRPDTSHERPGYNRKIATAQIDLLFLELSQFTRAQTGVELDLELALVELLNAATREIRRHPLGDLSVAIDDAREALHKYQSRKR